MLLTLPNSPAGKDYKVKIVGQNFFRLTLGSLKCLTLLHMQFYNNRFPLGFAYQLTARANILHRFLS